MSKEEKEVFQVSGQLQSPPVSLWHNRDYLLLRLGQSISSIGSGFSDIAFPLLVLFISRSPLITGIAEALRVFPLLILSLPAGALIDRWDRKWVMIICDTGRILNIASTHCLTRDLTQ